LNLDDGMGEGLDETQTGTGMEDSDDFDFSDVEKMLDIDDSSQADLKADEDADQAEEELELELDIESMTGEADLDGDAPDDDDLDLDFDLDFEADMMEADPADEAPEETRGEELPEGAEPEKSTDDDDLDLDLDLDLEMSLESDDGSDEGGPDEASAQELDLDLDLDLDMAPETDADGPRTEDALAPDVSDDLDFSDMGDMTDAIESGEEASENLDLDLDLDLEPAPEEDVSPSGEDDLDFSGLADMEMATTDEDSEEEPNEDAHQEVGDLDLDLDSDESALDAEDDYAATELMDESSVFGEALPDDDASEQVSGGEETEKIAETLGSDIITDDDMVSGLYGSAGATGKKKSDVLLLILLLIGIITGGVFGAYFLFGNAAINLPMLANIPFLGDMLSAPDSSGTFESNHMKITPLQHTIEGKYIKNSKSGTYFVVTGQVKNESDTSQKFIQVKGTLISNGGHVAQTQTVYCGNTFSNTALANLEIEKIKGRLSNRSGDNRKNEHVASGSSLTFAIVFSNLPENLENFSVEVVGSEQM